MGILRPRPEEDGGPWIEFPCPGCRTMLMLLPHGHSRYAVPGEPPPPPPNDRERRIPWVARAPAEPAGDAVAPPPRRPLRAAASKAPSPVEGPLPPPQRAPRAAPAPAAPVEPVEGPLDWEGAERLLGMPPIYTAADVERAFRRHALLCHPDKVSHLDEDFQALAAKKFKRLKEARDLLAGE